VLLLGKLVILCVIQGELLFISCGCSREVFSNPYSFIIYCNLIIIVIELISLFKRLTTGRRVF